ncbi:MAG: dihydroorotate dehydrogenase [Bacteroidales bacterium]|nr:dihydroorotate dehydrogenase [Bacteroidales bacterium]
MVDLSVNLCGVTLQNPVIPASGTFGFGAEMAEIYDLNVLGSISVKGTTFEPRFGNPTPRIAECPDGLLNSVGLQNPGAKVVAEEEIPNLRKHFHQPIIGNVCGFSLDDYRACCETVATEVEIVELNISCPNVHNGGMAFGTTPDGAASVVKAVREVCPRPLIVKLSPNVGDIVSIAKACEEAGADGLTLINTMLGMRIDIRRRKPVLARKMGGFSGPAIFPVALRMVYQVSKACRIPVVGCGGVASAEDVIEMMMAGATAVQVGSENLRNPFVCKQIVENLPSVMNELKINKLSEIIGIIE